MIEDNNTETSATPRQRAIDAYSSARDSVAGAGRRAKDTLTEAPLIALAGAAVVGFVVARLIKGGLANDNDEDDQD
jgi:hypothetical protein